MNLLLVDKTSADNQVEGDLALTEGQITLVDGTAAVKQHIANRIRFFFGEWFLDQRLGFPYFEQVFVKAPSLDVIRTLLRKTIEETPGVQSVRKLVLSLGKDRLLTVTFEAIAENSTEPLVFREFILKDPRD